MQVRGQEKLCMAAQGGMQGKGWHTLLLCGGVLLSSSFRCLRVSLFVPLGYLAANVRGYKIVPDCEVRLYPTIQNLMRDETLANPLNPACFITACYGQFSFILNVNIFS